MEDGLLASGLAREKQLFEIQLQEANLGHRISRHTSWHSEEERLTVDEIKKINPNKEPSSGREPS